MSRTLAFFCVLSLTALAQAKVLQRPIGSDCISGSLKSGGVRR